MKTIRYESPEQLRTAGLQVGDEVIIPCSWLPSESDFFYPFMAAKWPDRKPRPIVEDAVFEVAATGVYGAQLALVAKDLSRLVDGYDYTCFAHKRTAGWADSDLCFLLNRGVARDILGTEQTLCTGQLPRELQEAILPRTVRQTVKGGVEEKECRFWALSVTEMFGPKPGPLYCDDWLYLEPAAADDGEDVWFPLYRQAARRPRVTHEEEQSWWLRTLLDDECTLGTVVTQKGNLAPHPVGKWAYSFFGFLL